MSPKIGIFISIVSQAVQKWHRLSLMYVVRVSECLCQVAEKHAEYMRYVYRELTSQHLCTCAFVVLSQHVYWLYGSDHVQDGGDSETNDQRFCARACAR